MANLDNLEELKKLDPNLVAKSISLFPQQLEQAWSECQSVKIPDEFKDCRNIVVAGMGGSILGVDIIRHVFKENLTVPLIIVNHYSLPNFVDENSLVVLVTYSGTTEEVLAAAEDAKRAGAKIIGVTQGAVLGDFLSANQLPAYVFDPKNNPSKQPRLGTGYTFGGVLALLAKAGYLQVDEKQIASSTANAKNFCQGLGLEIKVESNLAKKMATDLLDKGAVVLAAEFLSGNAHLFANQVNECAKNFAVYHLLPELNHHLLEGLTNPRELLKNLHFVFYESDLYSPKLRKRVEITKEVLEKQGLRISSLKMQGDDELTQAMKGIVFSSWTSFYLGCLYGIDASQIPWVDYFKKRLAE